MIGIIGSGGHSKVIIDTIRIIYSNEELIIFDSDKNKVGKVFCGIEIVSIEEILLYANSGNFRFIIAIGNNKVRERISKEFTTLNWLTIAHPRAYISENVSLGIGTVVFAGAIIQPGSIIGDHVIINTAASVDHDCKIENYCQIAPGAHLCGNVHCKHGSFIGAGAVIKQGIEIGCFSMIGIGAAVVSDIADELVVVGVPAKPIHYSNL
eukprot:TRINITY_DN8070_c0_g1_i1.p1 TRINITY_DN8070_c0_g1~~TRINITY_DN8070_c0_g1_i1.p1  ORF type:complete len:209 (-),score=72.01 TRINITY_DN8070_c0_g1_i1:28-654(-)